MGVCLAPGHDAHRPRDGAADGWRGVFGATSGAEAVTRSLVFAHSDVSGLPLFEEAQFRGVTAADRVLRLIA